MRTFVSLSMTGALAAPAAFAAEMTVSVEIPRLNVAEYHRPYVALWLEKPDQSFVGNLAVWYDLKLKDNEGTKWLKDMRQWWRKSGRELTHAGRRSFERDARARRAQDHGRARQGAGERAGAGDYHLVIEAAREVGGRELLRVPFHWPVTAAQNPKVKGEHELGHVAIDIKP